jgi:hypothetical protein
MKLLDQIHSIINFATDKGVTGYHKPADIDSEIHAVSTDLWQKFYDEYAKTKKISSYMAPFEVVDTLTIPNADVPASGSGDSATPAIYAGIATMTKEIEHPTLVLGTKNTYDAGPPVVEAEADDVTDKEVHMRERYQWAKAINDSVAPPTPDYPICLFSTKDNTSDSPYFTIEVRPTSMTSITVYGLRKPVKPNWTYSIDATGRRVFNGSNENFQDIEWSELLFNDIRNRVLTVMGINLREEQITQFTQALKAETE